MMQIIRQYHKWKIYKNEKRNIISEIEKCLLIFIIKAKRNVR